MVGGARRLPRVCCVRHILEYILLLRRLSGGLYTVCNDRGFCCVIVTNDNRAINL